MRLSPEPAEVRLLVDLEHDLNTTARDAHKATTLEELRSVVADQGLLIAKYLQALFGVVVEVKDGAEMLEEHQKRNL